MERNIPMDLEVLEIERAAKPGVWNLLEHQPALHLSDPGVKRRISDGAQRRPRPGS